MFRELCVLRFRKIEVDKIKIEKKTTKMLA